MFSVLPPVYISNYPSVTQNESGKWHCSLATDFSCVLGVSTNYVDLHVTVLQVDSVGTVTQGSNNVLTLDLNSLPGILPSTWASLSLGYYFSTALALDGTIWTWGINDKGQLGTGIPGNTNIPAQVGLATNWTQVCAGLDHVLAINSLGELWAWGYNDNSQLGDGTTTQRDTPVQIGVDTDWEKLPIKVYGDTSFAIKTDGTLWGWGQNIFGNIGDGSTSLRSTPVQVGTSVDWDNISALSGATVGRQIDGTDKTLWSWGSNSKGQLGDGTTSSRTSPGLVNTDTDWEKFSGGSQFVLATKTDQTLWSWGSNTGNALGRGSLNLYESSPGQVGVGLYTALGTGTTHAIAVKTDGTAWVWGTNSSGQLGIGDLESYDVPTLQNTKTNWVQPSAGHAHTGVVNSADEVLTFGNNFYGQLGLGYIYNAKPVSLNFSSVYDLVNDKILSVFEDTVVVLENSSFSVSIAHRYAFINSEGLPEGFESSLEFVEASSKAIMVTQVASTLYLQTLEYTGLPSISESILSAQFLPAGSTLTTGTPCLVKQVGISGDVIIALNVTTVVPAETNLVFIRANTDTLAISAQFQCLDTDGTPVSLSADKDSDTFVLEYLDSSSQNVKLVVGKLSGASSIIFGTPSLYNSGVFGNSNIVADSSNWVTGTSSIISSLSNSLGLDIVLSEIDSTLLEITPNLAEKQTYSPIPSYSIAGSFSTGNQKSVTLLYGDGSVDTANTDKVYAIVSSESSESSVALEVATALALELTGDTGESVDVSLEVATALALELTSDTGESVDVSLEVGLGLAIRLNASQGITDTTLEIGMPFALKLEASLDYAQLNIGSAVAFQLTANYVKQADIQFALSLGLKLQAIKPLAGTLKIRLNLANKYTAELAPNASLYIGLGQATQLSGGVLKSATLEIGISFGIELSIGCVSNCDPCVVQSYSSLGVY